MRRWVVVLVVGLMSWTGYVLVQDQHQPAHAQTLGESVDPSATARADFSAVLAQQTPPTDELVSALTANVVALGKDFPHIELYGGANSSGWPFVGDLNNTRPPEGAPLNSTVLDQYARFPFVVSPVTPLADTRLDVIPALRQRNPNIDIRGYVMASTTWCPQDSNGNIAYPANTYYRDYWLAVTGGSASCTQTNNNRFLWMQDGIMASEAPHNLGINVNLAHRVDHGDGTYTYDVAEGIADDMYAYGKASKNWDGIFIDVYCPVILWMESPGHLFDYVRAGYGVNQDGNGNFLNDAASRSAFDQGWQAGALTLAQRLRADAVADGHPDYVISGNCGQAPVSYQSYLNGWMREGFPFQNTYAGAADFYSNLLAWPWGYLHQDRNFLSPQSNYIFTPSWPDYYDGNGKPVYSPYNATNLRRMRFGIGSAALGNGIGAFHDSSADPAQGLWFQWWYDEYGVNTRVRQSDPAWGHTVTDPSGNGWLGQPKNPAHADLATNFATTTDLLTQNQSFETAGATPDQLPGWQFIVFSPAVGSVERDTTTAGAGSASAHVRVTTLATPAISYSVNLNAGDFPITAGQDYSITFRAKADHLGTVHAWFGSVDSVAGQFMPIDTEWRLYQAVIHASQTNAHAHLQLSLALETGEYWIDDAHVQLGATAVWRRDFDKGIVLVNPSKNSLTVNLDKPYRKIAGTVNPTLNDGSVVTSVTLPGTNSGNGYGDAIFLLNYDNTPPATVNDLR